MVKIIITKGARERLRYLKLYYKKEPSRAEAIISKIREGYNTLRLFPQAGCIELSLENHRIVYRSLVVDKHFKLIYYIDENNIVIIVSIWDCRQNPIKLFDDL